MEIIKDTVRNVMRALKTKKSRPAAYDLEVLLKKILTKKEIEHIKFNYSRGGILALNVDSSAWLYKLNLKKETLLAVLNKKSNNLKDIRFYLGEIK